MLVEKESNFVEQDNETIAMSVIWFISRLSFTDMYAIFNYYETRIFYLRVFFKV
jgi:hypothetical protein